MSFLDNLGVTYFTKLLKGYFAAIKHTHNKSDITDFPSTFPPSSHTHSNYLDKDIVEAQSINSPVVIKQHVEFWNSAGGLISDRWKYRVSFCNTGEFKGKGVGSVRFTYATNNPSDSGVGLMGVGLNGVRYLSSGNTDSLLTVPDKIGTIATLEDIEEMKTSRGFFLPFTQIRRIDFTAEGTTDYMEIDIKSATNKNNVLVTELGSYLYIDCGFKSATPNSLKLLPEWNTASVASELVNVAYTIECEDGNSFNGIHGAPVAYSFNPGTYRSAPFRLLFTVPVDESAYTFIQEHGGMKRLTGLVLS